jgi:hypothetical protein
MAMNYADEKFVVTLKNLNYGKISASRGGVALAVHTQFLGERDEG